MLLLFEIDGDAVGDAFASIYMVFDRYDLTHFDLIKVSGIPEMRQSNSFSR